MTDITFIGKITDFHPTKNGTVKIAFEAALSEGNAKLLWLLDQGLTITVKTNQMTLDEDTDND